MKTFSRWIITCLAALAFLAPLKFGTPVVTQSSMFVPLSFFEWVLESWPNQMVFLFIFAALWWVVLDSKRPAVRVDALFVLPLIFLVSQVLAMPGSMNRQGSADTLVHFACCVLLFYAAAWYVRDSASATRVFGGLALATMLVCVAALRQYFGGLEETRRFAALYLDPTTTPKDFLLRLTSNRPFAWFGGYPNALAGYLVIAFAPTLAWIWDRARAWDTRVKWITLVVAGGLMVFCLVLTGSRGGFAAFGIMALTTLGCCVPKGNRRSILAVVGLVVALAVVAVLGQRGGLLHFGTQSVESRMDYWRGAVAIAKDHPWVGTGPGTFGSIYPKYKTALTEEAQTVHNNFLQMWSDSGVLAFVAFALLWIVAVRDAFRLTRRRVGDAAAIAICGALTGWTLHGLVDFDLYVPGVALPAFILLGVMQGLKELPRTDTVTPPGRANWLVGSTCVIVLAVVFWIEGRALAAGFAYTRSQDLEKTDPWAAFGEAKRAAELAPWNPYYKTGFGHVAFLVGRMDEAIAAYRKAAEDDPYRASCWLRLAEAKRAVYGVDAEVLQLLRKAVELNPQNPRYRQALVAAEKSVRQSPGTLLEFPPTKEE